MDFICLKVSWIGELLEFLKTLFHFTIHDREKINKATLVDIKIYLKHL